LAITSTEAANAADAISAAGLPDPRAGAYDLVLDA
jgi:hypothetical protein